MIEKYLEQFKTAYYSNTFWSMRDLEEYHTYHCYGRVVNDKFTGFGWIRWNISFSSAYSPLSHFMIGHFEPEYKLERNLEGEVPTIKGVKFIIRDDDIDQRWMETHLSEDMIAEKNEAGRLTFVGQHKNGVRHGIGAEIGEKGNNLIQIGFWEEGVLKYRFDKTEWIKVE